MMTRDNEMNFGGSCSIDTTFVLFFLAIELGRSADFFAFDTLLMAITTLMFAVLPYFVPSTVEPPAFGQWLVGRGVIALFGVFLGVGFQKAIGTILPDTLSLLPMTCLIVAAIASCYFQFYGLMKLRLAK